ncbi:MAG: hypothetical protein F6J98_02405 [Moorea sp. SIO4G2]|nr:hypothetical protein [Moorena sp. SIO4G2]
MSGSVERLRYVAFCLDRYGVPDKVKVGQVGTTIINGREYEVKLMAFISSRVDPILRPKGRTSILGQKVQLEATERSLHGSSC